jgi:hypothetical protein
MNRDVAIRGQRYGNETPMSSFLAANFTRHFPAHNAREITRNSHVARACVRLREGSPDFVVSNWGDIVPILSRTNYVRNANKNCKC